MNGWRRLAAVSTAALLLAGMAACSTTPRQAAPAGPTSTTSPQRAPAVRGVVTAVTAASVTVRVGGGTVRTFRFGLKTKVRRAGADASVDDLRVGERVAIFGGTGGQGIRRIVIQADGNSTLPAPTPSAEAT